MPDQSLPFELPDVLATQANRRWDDTVGMSLLRRLTGADYLSLVALFFAWTSTVLLLQERVHLGILVMFGAFAFDKLDGYYARTRGVTSSFGRQVDTFIDIFAYLVTAALLYHVVLSPSWWATVVVGFAIVTFGGLRLVRHADEGFGESDGTSYYVGWTVVHANFVVLALVYLEVFMGRINGWLAALPIVVAGLMMVSGYKSYKTTLGHVAGAILICLAATTSLLVVLTGGV